MRHLVGFSLLVGFSGLFGCSLSTVGSMDPTQGGKCESPMQKETAKDMCTVCTCTGAGTWDCNSDACPGAGGSGPGTGGTNGMGTGGSGTGASPGAGGTDAMGTGGMSMGGTGMGGSAGSGACMPGESKLADDGCNKCTCTETGEWACTLVDCAACTPMETMTVGCQSCVCNATGSWDCTTIEGDDCPAPPPCMLDETIPAGDGCNICTCWGNGTFICTKKACPKECPPPLRYDPKTCMSTGDAYAQDPTTGQCCAYSSSCQAPPGWKVYDTPGCGVPQMCSAGTADCDGDASNGCETKLSADPNNCGACGLVCMSPAGVMAACNDGVCTYPGSSSGSCLYAGVNHTVGDSFPSRDGCNTCGCVVNPDGTTDIACTERACMCNPDDEPYRQYAATSPDGCKTIDFACPSDTTMFSNECGCGCEQSVECPNEFDCSAAGMAGMLSCDAALMERCPYSEVLTDGLR
jgi:hypothetical protein